MRAAVDVRVYLAANEDGTVTIWLQGRKVKATCTRRSRWRRFGPGRN